MEKGEKKKKKEEKIARFIIDSWIIPFIVP